jgi:hypothetical protein
LDELMPGIALSLSLISLATKIGGAPSGAGSSNVLLMEDGSRLLLEDGSAILLELQDNYLLQEDGFRLLQEDGSSILLEA